MSLFQNTVVSKYLQTQNKELLATKWSQFKSFFHNPEIQKNIRNSKEEQYQGEFLIDLFVNILGYTKNPTPNYNLTTEYKNIKDSKKADGAIIIHQNVKAVIELKGTNTTDLGKIETQAFGYKNNQPECSYVITSNFEKLRFYIDNAIEHIELNLFTLTEKEFELLYLCLAYENIAKDIPKKLKDESVGQEDVITKKLYHDYSLFKRELHQSLVVLNPQYDALILFKKSQKLIDRFLFLFFAEDRQLLPPNSVRLILEQWKQLAELDEPIPLYNRFKKYFGYLNTGFKGKNYDVYAYNGGLFKPDEILDAIKIDDHLLYNHAFKLSEYDFISEVDVNILGHIFENSLNELDEITAQLEGQEVDKTKTKRKKDGVFYTPKYITKYIVDNTIGKLCAEKKAALQIIEEEYSSSTRGFNPLNTSFNPLNTSFNPLTESMPLNTRFNPLPESLPMANPLTKKKKQELLSKLTDYRNWLLELTICDPACGSGAFLNQALDYLITEHKYIDELQAKLFGDAMVLSDVEKSILENNLFGVDINEESVEIAKLSLWLRTAQPNRKLNDLNNNIKCGNSLIDDPTVAGDKAFNWQLEFPQVFKEKNKKAFHITTAVHDSRTSERMIEFKVREKRDLGTNPYPNINYFTEEDEFVITQTIAEIVKSDHLNVLAYNICADHIHLLLVCEEEEVSSVVQKIKSKTARAVNLHREVSTSTREQAPLPIKQKINSLWTQKFGCKEITTEEHLFTAIDYIKHNRSKHNLPQHSKEIKLLVENFVCDYKHAFREQYNGGFDVVIGNPPYVRRTQLNENIKEFIEKVYYSAYKQYDLYVLFNELSIKILKNKGYIGFIQPNKFLSADYGFKIKNLLKNNTIIESIFNVSLDNVFSEASVYPYIFIFRKKVNIKDFIEENINLLEHCNPENLKGFGEFTNSNSLINKLKEKSITLGNLTKSIKRGIPNSKIEFSKGGDFYGIKSTLLEYSFYLPKPDIKFNYLSNEDKIKKSVEFSQNLFLLPRTTLKIRAVYKNNEYHILDRIYFFENINIKFLNEFILCMLNSNLTTFYYNNSLCINKYIK